MHFRRKQMKHAGRVLAQTITVIILAVALGACGGSPWRFVSGIADKPASLVATAGNGQVSLSWPSATGAASYTVYYSESPGVSAATGTAVPVGLNTAAVIANLVNGTRYYFAVAAVTSAGASALSPEASAIPSLPGPFLPADLQGTWRFNALVSGAGARWLRGAIDIDASGGVSVTSFLDSSGASVPPAGLFGALTVLPDGTVLQVGGTQEFHGALAANLHKDLMVATAGAGAASPTLMILQKVVPGIVFNVTDIQGTGQAGAGPLPMVYHQLSSGAVSEWETGSIQVGRDQRETYFSLNGPTARALPGAGSKVVILSLTGDGFVSEAPNPGALQPQPAALITQGVMSADKMTIVGTATDARGAFILRVIHLVHPPATALTAGSYPLADLSGSYSYHALTSGASPLWAYGTEAFDATGLAGFSAYRDASGSSALPGSLALLMDSQGNLTQAGDPTFNGQFSYFKDMIVATRTEGGGASSLSIALRGPN
jgi:hypothetical protein